MTEAPIRRSQLEWDTFFLDFAVQVALLSKDPDRKVGAVLVPQDKRQLSIGYNGFPPQVEDLPSSLRDKSFKLMFMVHAEENCLRQSPFNPAGCTLYVTRFPCLDCAERIASAGVIRVVGPEPELGHARWGPSWSHAVDHFRRFSVVVEALSVAGLNQLDIPKT